MNFFQRAIKNTTRKLSKSVLLALTFFVIGNFVIVGLGISNAAEQAKVMTRKQMRAAVTYQLDYEAFWDYIEELPEEEQMEAYNHYPYITDDEIQALMADDRIKSVNAITNLQAWPIDIEGVPLNNEYEQNNYGSSMSCWIDETGQEVCEEYTWVDPELFIKANGFSGMIEFSDEMYILKEGRMYTQEEIEDAEKVCLITDTLAEHNNLRVGDMIEISFESPSNFNNHYNSWYSEMGLTEEDFKLELEVIGIFDNTQIADPTADNFDWMAKYESPENIVLMPDSIYAEHQLNISLKSWEYYKQMWPDDEYYQNEDNMPTMDNILSKSAVTLLLNDPLEVDSFVEQVQASLDGQYRLLDANNETFEQLSRPLDTLTLFSSMIVVLVLVNAVVIITLVTALTLKTREYEIGVLLSQGVSKFMVIAQFFVELALVAVLGFTLAVGSGSLIAGRVGEAVLQYQVEFSGLNETEVDDDYNYISNWNDNYFTEISLSDMVDAYEVQISPLIIGEIYVAGLGIVLISILIPSLMIMRYNPKKILMSAQ
ncbi:MAG: ABC transporter permease [Erysipelotrichaceae bacterium]|nr:ABC transporter permease [Erysipelotrichaceae bacterium]